MEAWLSALGGVDAWLLYGLVTLLIAGESAAVAAVLLPGELALVTAGVWVAQGGGSLALVLAVATVAAVAGQAIGYEVGRRYGTRVFAIRPLRRYAIAIERTSSLVARHGAVAVLLGRWTNVGRVLVPIMVGAGRMPYRSFTVYNVLGGISWVVVFVLLGRFAGASLDHLLGVLGRIGWSISGLGTAALVVVWVSRYGRRRLRSRPARLAPVVAATTVASTTVDAQRSVSV